MTPGVAPGELVPKELVYWLDAEEHAYRPETVKRVDKTGIVFSRPWSPNVERTVPPGEVIPARRLRAGDWFLPRAADERRWLVATDVTESEIGATLATGPKRWKLDAVMIPTRERLRLDRTGCGLYVALTPLAIALLVVGVRRKLRSKEVLERDATAAAPETRAAPKGRLSVLACQACGASVPLAAVLSVSCAYCGSPLEVPPDYIELVCARDSIAGETRREARALSRATIAGHPAVAALVLIAGCVLFPSSFVWREELARLYLGFGAFAVVLFLPFVVVTAAIGAVLGGPRLRSIAASLSARRSERGDRFACRACGAPLGETRDGVAELCANCGAENLIASALAASASEAREVERALALNIACATDAFWASVWRILSVVFMLGGFVGTLFFPIAAWALGSELL